MFDVELMKKVAEAELKHEMMREAIDAYKKKLKASKWYHKLFPYRIVFIRREV